VAACAGDHGPFTYKRSRRGNAEIDRAVALVLENSGRAHRIQDFFPYGYDERQFCSPGFNLPVGSLMRTPHGQYPEYHTSADNLDFVSLDKLFESLEVYLQICRVLEENITYLNLNPKCEPQLGRRGLYNAIGGHSDSKNFQMAMLWVLNLADGHHDLLAMARRSGLDFGILQEAASMLYEADLIDETERSI
jgi:aminopeptidase-like protein